MAATKLHHVPHLGRSEIASVFHSFKFLYGVLWEIVTPTCSFFGICVSNFSYTVAGARANLTTM